MTVEFRYTAWSRRGGQETSGSMRAASAEDVRRLVEDGDLLVLAVEETNTRSVVSRELHLIKRGVRPADIAWLARQLATTERAGLPIKRALETMASQREHTAIGDVVADISRRLSDGDDLAAAFAAHRDTLGAVPIALVAAGATGGTMAGTFEKVATTTEAHVAIRRQVRGALVYPAVVLTLSVVMTVSMLVFVVPTFAGLYAQLNGRLPLATRMLVALSGFVRADFWAVPAVALAAALGIRRWRANPENAMRIDRAKVRIPLVGPLILKGAVARVAATLASLLDAGVTTLVAIEMSADAAGLRPLAASLSAVGERIRDGRSLTSALAEDGAWPDVMVQLAGVGEETGQVSELLGRYAEISDEEVTSEVERVVGLIEPLMVLLIGGIVGLTVVCLYLPLFDLVNLVK